MKVIQIYIKNVLKNFNYILYSEKTKEAIFFDPYNVEMGLNEAKKRGLRFKYLINTHHHFDHVKGNKAFLKLEDTIKLEMKDGDVFEFSETEKVVCKNTPGHTMDHQCFFLYNNDKLEGVIAGDTLFNAGVGNCKNGGDPETLYQTIRDIFYSLDDDVKIYPSHDYFLNNLKFAKTVDPENMIIEEYLKKVENSKQSGLFMITTIGEEKKYNPFFRVLNSDISFWNLGEKEEFIKLRNLRDNW